MKISPPQVGRYYYVGNEPTLFTEKLLQEILPHHRPQPIRLTKQWLIEFGFRPDSARHFWFFQDLKLVPGLNCWLCVSSRRYLHYVHELQECFADIYQMELPLKIQS
ncbi:hypothetical protein [Larkinella rosea]|uniref:Uncharacterized protein n=1 Tax=Larkinella rosea TaxID=2025312 RepID=A0A3P1BKN8_9BACT|nr:hypothetical protein [Larkinella rosea]RRB01254.1 hypothetical protein EHT25_24090 [Larkinella rosea]